MPIPKTRWALIVVSGQQGDVCRIWVEGEGTPDMGTIDEMARLMHRAKLSGRQVQVEQVVPELAELIELSGLGGEPGWQPQVQG
jgi:hypothetical protein